MGSRKEHRYFIEMYTIKELAFYNFLDINNVFFFRICKLPIS